MNEVLGVGVDIEHVSRFLQFLVQPRHPFIEKVFTDKELVYCFSQAQPAEHLAARYAAKEAVVKALAGVLDDAIAYNEIEIGRNAKGAPTVRIGGVKSRSLIVKISISHTSDVAAAFVIIMSKGL